MAKQICPLCGSAVRYSSPLELVIGLVTFNHNYVCTNQFCGWEGVLETRRSQTVSDVITVVILGIVASLVFFALIQFFNLPRSKQPKSNRRAAPFSLLIGQITINAEKEGSRLSAFRLDPSFVHSSSSLYLIRS